MRFFNNIIVVLLLFYIVLDVLIYRYDNRYTQICEEAGGVAVITPGKGHCINPSAIIELKGWNK